MDSDEEINESLIQLALRESLLNDVYCSADGKGVLCGNYATTQLPCNHHVCDFHIYECIACYHNYDYSVLKIQRQYRRYLLKKKLHQLATRRDRAATLIIGFFKIIKAKKMRRDMHYRKCRANFLAKFEGHKSSRF